MVGQVKKFLENGAWRGWLLGIVATVVATAITTGLIFQREVSENIAKNEQRIGFLEKR